MCLDRQQSQKDVASGMTVAYFEHPRIYVINAGITVGECAALRIQDCNCVSLSDFRTFHFVASTRSVEVQREALVVNIGELQLQMMKCH
jgi:hypothetical protein